MSNKLAELCDVMEIHALILIRLAYRGDERRAAPNRVPHELDAIAEHNEKKVND
ncbi:hypothetical protein [Burkholderia cepacia]|uniref:hypothetical protein n=1 Tax=Burkholderia cepacia TaxID=292 RepID=UPI0018C5F4EE|nr:hypothetical protein [Burkholderia cepacia]